MVDDQTRKRLAVRTVVVSYRAALRHARKEERERLRRRALELLEVVAVRVESERDPEFARLLDDARQTVSETGGRARS